MILNFSLLILIDIPLKKKKKPWEFITCWTFKNSIIRLIIYFENVKDLTPSRPQKSKKKSCGLCSTKFPYYNCLKTNLSFSIIWLGNAESF